IILPLCLRLIAYLFPYTTLFRSAHGFSVLSETALVMYKCDAFYNKESEAGIIYNDVDLAIDWRLPGGAAIVSEKDLELPSFKERSEEHTSELQSRENLVCRLLLE